MRAFICRHPALTYFALSFSISWGGLLAVGGLRGMSGSVWQSDPKLPLLIVAMLAGPSVAGLLMTSVVSGRAGLRALSAQLLKWRVGAHCYAVALLAAPVVFIGVHLALSLASPVFRPNILTTGDAVSSLLFAIAGALAIGVFEELGWTGFAIPHVRRRHGALLTGLLVGVPWGAWHLLTNDFWIGGTYSGDLSLPLFLTLNGLTLVMGQLPAYRVLMVWVYDWTGSLFVAMLMHASLSASTFVLGPTVVTGRALVAYGFALAAAWWAVVALVALVKRAQASRQPRRSARRRAPARSRLRASSPEAGSS